MKENKAKFYDIVKLIIIKHIKIKFIFINKRINFDKIY